jgi:hypothetical protein
MNMSKSCCGGTGVSERQVKKDGCACSSGVPKADGVSMTDSSCPKALVEPVQGYQNESSHNTCTRVDADWIIGYIQTPAGEIPQVSTKLSFTDILGSWKCRWSIGRMDYKVEPGLYAVGTPDDKAPVLVTANYKMTFDRLREQLAGLNLWIVVLDTDGVNVWCAAGKGTFGTEEVVNRITAIHLSDIVTHRNIILPQLGAVGIAAHEVLKQTGFHVIYGTVRAKDLKAFFANNMKATEEMRTVKFTLADRIVLTPMELVGSLKPLLIAFGILFILNAIGFGHYGRLDFIGLIGAVLVGVIITPVLLPWVPGRAFSFKGGLLGLFWAAGFLILTGFPSAPQIGWLKAVAYFLLLPSLSGFCTMNFTGSSTFTSLSGVDKEMKIALPIMLFASAGAVLLLLISDFIVLFGGALI